MRIRMLGFASLLVVVTACSAERAEPAGSGSDDLRGGGDEQVYPGGAVGYDVATAKDGAMSVVYAPGFQSASGSYTSHQLVLASKAPTGSWKLEEILQERFIQDPRIAIASTGTRFISYVGDYYNLRVAHESAPGVFVSESVHQMTGNDSVESVASIAVDAAGRAHVAYAVSRFPNQELWYANRDDAGAWHESFVEMLPLHRVVKPRIAVGGGRIRIISESYQPTHPHEVRYAERSATGGTWATSSVAPGQAPALALDASGAPHVSYFDGEVLFHASLRSGQWTRDTVATSDFPLAATHVTPRLDSRIGVDDGGGIHVAFSDTGYLESQLRYTSKAPGAASFEVARVLVPAPHADTGVQPPEMAVAPNGDTQLVYYSFETTDLRFYALRR